MKIFSIILSVVLFFSCQQLNFDAPEFKTLKNVKVVSVSGDEVKLEGIGLMHNPNPIGLEISSVKFNVEINDKRAGTAVQTLDTKMPANSDFEFPVTYSFDPAEVLGDGGILGIGLQILTNRKIKVKYDGTFDVGIGKMKVEVPFDYEGNIDLNQKDKG